MPVDIKEYDVALYVKVETTEGIAATIAAADAIYATEMSWSPKEKLVRRDLRTQARPLDTVDQALLQWWEFSATIPYNYSGTAGTPSPLDDIFRMCGAAQTIVAATSVTYARDTLVGFDSATVEMRTPTSGATKDYRRKALGARGSLDFKIATGEDISLTVGGVGAYSDPDSVAVIAPTYGNQRANIFGAPRPSLVTARALNGKALCLYEVSAKNFFGFGVDWLESMCLARAEPNSDENGYLTVKMKMPDWDTEFNPFAYANRSAVSRIPFSFAVGTVVGKKIEISVDEVQVGEPKEIFLPDKSRGIEVKLNILHNPKWIEK